MSSSDGFDDVATLARPRIARGSVGAAFRLRVAAGPDAGATLLVDGASASRVLVGQSPACALILRDREVSRRHCAVELDRAALRVTDLGSTNGTFVGDVRIGDAWLTGGETLRIGATLLHVERADGDAAPPPTSEVARFGKLVGRSPEMVRLYPLCARLAASSVPLVIEGETGTGKEVLAEALHEAGPRASGPFVVFDCTAIAPSLLEAALFGHDRGAFTGASEARAGVFEEAHGGTLLVDEIGDLDIALQAKLLRALERGEVRRVGGKKWLDVDVRVIAATRRDLDAEVQAGRFRDDLFFRLAVTRIELPPLRRRSSDIALLAAHFFRTLGGPGAAPTPEQLARFESYAWPGNVRELQNAVARLLALGDLAADDAALSARTGARATPGPGPHAPPPTAVADVFEDVLALGLPLPRARQRVVDAFEARYVARVLAEHGGNVGRAAEASGLARRYFQILRARHKGEG